MAFTEFKLATFFDKIKCHQNIEKKIPQILSPQMSVDRF